MSAFQRLFKQTFIYGLATVLPRMFSFLLVPLYTSGVLLTAEYGQISIIFSYFIILNVLLSYGMETAFFRFYTKNENQKNVLSTSSWSLVISSFLFFLLAFFLREQISSWVDISVKYLSLVIWILLLDALTLIPFAYLRATERPIRYAVVKILNVVVNLALNIFFLIYLPKWAENGGFFQNLYVPDFEISYVFIANVIASGITLALMFPFYFRIKFSFDVDLWKKMFQYSFPVLIAGLAFSVNTAFDKILLDNLLPADIAESAVGMYSACYKLAIFMTLFATAFRLGIEPFFFSHASSKNAPETYAKITLYFIVFGSLILVAVVVFIDVLKQIIIQDEAYWSAMGVVPLVLLANLFLGIYHNLSVWYKITDRTRFGAYISIFGAVVSIGLNLLLIPTMSYMGSAIALLAAYVSMVFLSYYFGQKLYPIPYNLKKIIGYLTLSIGICVLSFYGFRGNYFIGSLLLISFMGIVYFAEKEEFKKIMRL